MISFPYTLIFLLTVFLFLVNNTFNLENHYELIKSNKIFTFYSLYFCYMYFFACRGLVGADWPAYYERFLDAPLLSSGLNSINNYLDGSRFGKGYNYFIIFFKTFCNNFLGLQFVFSTMDFILLHKVFKYHCGKYYILAWAFYGAFSGYFQQMIFLRNIQSVVLFAYSIKYINSRNPIKYFACNLIGLSFHASSIFYFPLYFVYKLKRRKKLEILIFVTGNVIYFLRFPWLKNLMIFLYPYLSSPYNELVYAYLNSDTFGGPREFGIGFLERAFTFIFFYKCMNKYFNNDKNLKIFWYIFLLYIYINLYCTELEIIVSRVGGLFSISYWILYPKIYQKLPKEKKYLFIILFLIYGILKLYPTFNYSWATYENFLIDSIDYDKRLKNYF